MKTIHCPEARDPFLRAFRAEAVARYERMQAQRRRAEFDRSIRCSFEVSMRATLLHLLVNAQASVASSRGAP